MREEIANLYCIYCYGGKNLDCVESKVKKEAYDFAEHVLKLFEEDKLKRRSSSDRCNICDRIIYAGEIIYHMQKDTTLCSECKKKMEEDCFTR